MEWILKPHVVAACIAELRGQKIHPNFAGYLCVRRTAARDSRGSQLQVNYKEFYEAFLRVPDAPPEEPYVRIFWDSAPSDANRWFNKNVAGSYAPSSLRTASPFLHVVSFDGIGKNARYTLKDKHWELAYQHLLYGNQVSAVCLPAVLYRDYALSVEAPSASDLVSIFKEEFGYVNAQAEFDCLYADDSAENPRTEWFETYAG